MEPETDFIAGRKMLEWARDLFPLPRSLTGDGVVATLEYLRAINSNLEIKGIATGTKVFDWEIPSEWKIRDAYIQHVSTGRKYAQFSELNLHLVGYSMPVDATMNLEELLPRIYTEPTLPHAVPYVTSYYERSWGFCMSEREKSELPSGEYRVLIESDHVDGVLSYADAKIQGRSNREVLFSSYVCHPSMVNNELSGPVLMSALLQHIREEMPDPYYSYRFVFVPETIGSLAYLQENIRELKTNVVAGFNLSCVGDDRSYSHIESRLGGTLADDALEASFIGLPNTRKYSFLHRGSDERQYCAPGVDLPLAGFCRTKYGEYPEYHTSSDNFDVVTMEGLQGSFDLMKTIVEAFEFGLYPRVSVLGEPQMGKRGLYPSVSKKGSYGGVRNRMNILAYADGIHSVFDISRIIEVPLVEVLKELEVLVEAGVIDRSYRECGVNSPQPNLRVP